MKQETRIHRYRDKQHFAKANPNKEQTFRETTYDKTHYLASKTHIILYSISYEQKRQNKKNDFLVIILGLILLGAIAPMYSREGKGLLKIRVVLQYFNIIE